MEGKYDMESSYWDSARDGHSAFTNAATAIATLARRRSQLKSQSVTAFLDRPIPHPSSEQQQPAMYRRAPCLLNRIIVGGGRRSAAAARPFSTDLPAAPTEDTAFVEAWRKVAPNVDPPKTPLAFMKPRPAVSASIPTKLTVNFVLPYQSEIANKEVSPSVLDRSTYISPRVSLCYLVGPVYIDPFDLHLDNFCISAKQKTGMLNRCLFVIDMFASEVDMVIVPATTGQMGVLPGHVATIAELKPGVLSVHEGNDVTKYFVSSGFAFIHPNSVTDIIAVEAAPLDNIDPTLVQKGLADFTQKLNSATTDLEKAEAQIGVDVHSALNAALSG
ncbi:hypothetical protein ZIOFF_043960 [Zingiber officinale]|uniref:ATP synthase F1 complex delta/epsilon subunit N-terminal domain-containing protein n=1 Tax=Zingiber officinale TaxID=94328 RepID=A0A8J5GBD6_ZINOF|nr:hypothetical protein ZIOFF_043960 [Zingiber officinale]